MIYICIPVYNRIDYTRKCIQSIRNQSIQDYSIVLCDDGSTDDTRELLSNEYPEVEVLQGNGTLWWSGATNKCVDYVLQRARNTDYVFTLNNDAELAENTLETLIRFSARHPKSLIACGNYFSNAPTRLEATAFVAKDKWPFSRYHRPLFPYGTERSELKDPVYEVHSVSGKGVLIPVEVFHKIGLYRADLLPQYHGDTEFSRRASQAGYKLFIHLDAMTYTDQHATGIGQVNSPQTSIQEFLSSFFSLRSENYLPSLYHRSRLIYENKWPVYLLANMGSILSRFILRYLSSIKNSTCAKSSA